MILTRVKQSLTQWRLSFVTLIKDALPKRKPLSEAEEKERKQYEGASNADQLRLANYVNDQITNLTSAELGSLPVISAVAATLLIVATFNPKLVPLNFTVRILLSILMLIVPIALFFYLHNVGKAKRRGLRLMYIYTQRKFQMKGFDKISYSVPWILMALLFVVVVCIVVLIL